MNSTHNTRLCLKAKAKFEKQPKLITVKGRPAQTLLELIKSGNKGITALEMSNTWALRLSAYVFNLRHDYALDIETLREEHGGGWHARYVLHTGVDILCINNKE